MSLDLSAPALKHLKLPAAQGEELLVGAGHLNLERLASSAPNPHSLDDLADKLGCEALLLYRVAQRRQPLPRQLVLPAAAALGVQAGEVESAAGEVLDLGFGSGVALGAGFRAIPPDRALGDALFLLPVSPTVAPTFGG